MTLDQIKQAVLEGHTVYWKSTMYTVTTYKGSWYIFCLLNKDVIGLTWQDGVTLNGDEKDFYILGV